MASSRWGCGEIGNLTFDGNISFFEDKFVSVCWTFLNWSISHGKGNGTPLQYSCLENPMDGGAWWAAVHGVDEGQTRLSDFTFTFHFHALEKEMATYSSVLAWRIPGTGEPGGLPSMGSHRVGHDWSDSAAAVQHSVEFPLCSKVSQPYVYLHCNVRS